MTETNHPSQISRLADPRRITEHDWPEGTVALVSIICWTYNHERFIAQCIESFLMQETDFSVEILIHDDASTDRTAEIIREYHAKHPYLIRPILQTENQVQNGKNFVPHLFALALGSYVAVCDGDDHWCDPEKLALQVDMMEQHKECSLCFHPVAVMDEASDKVGQEYPEIEARVPFQGVESFVNLGNFTPTCSVMVRKKAWSDIPRTFDSFSLGDWPMWLLTSLNGPVACIDRVMGCYRVHGGGAWSSLSHDRRLSGETGTWERLLPLLPSDIATLARDRLVRCYMRQLSTAEPSNFRTRAALAVRWLFSSLKQGSLTKWELGYVAGKVFPWLNKFR
jgi:glycosyltransferase involved in cell wall biosynthesis